jgi:heat shock protein HslJ
MRRIFVLAVLAVAIGGCISSREATIELPGTSWQLAELDGAPPVEGAVPTLEFREDGTAGGNASCNTYSADVSIDGSELSFGPIGMTRMMCADPAAADQETAFTAALESVSSYTVDPEGRLVLEGDVPMTFEVAPEGG